MSDSHLHIVKYPDPVLRKRAVKVDRITPELQDFIAAMAEIMEEADGVGLAAPQLGVSLRIIVVNAGNTLHAVINPQITAGEGSQHGSEGCLSLPGLHGDVTRAQHVVVSGLNRRGRKITLSGDGLWARAMQHEIDHLDGTLFIDRADADSLHWVTGERDEQGDYVTRPTSLEDAKQFFEQRYAALRA